ncbi:MAG: NTPase [Candidatus Helarchaeota archaeon]
MEHNILITGRPRTGKSTLIFKIIKALEAQGKKIGGILTPEIKGRKRLGFKIIDVGSNREGTLAHINQKKGPKVSKYTVNMEDLENIGVKGIKYAIDKCDYIIIDEIGKMELFSKNFQDVILNALDTKKVIGTIGYTLSHPLAKQIKNRADVELIILTVENRDKITNELLRKVESQ